MEAPSATDGAHRFRGFTFTINNWDESDVEFLTNLYNGGTVRYLVFGKEIAPSTGTPHLQGYIYFMNPRTFNGVKKMFKPNHIEVARTIEAAANYCKEDGDYTEFGDLPEQGKRNDIELIKEMVKNGASKQDIYDVSSNWQTYRMGEKGIELRKGAKRNWKTEVYWFWGATGTGKSRRAFDEAPDAWVSGNIVNNFVFDGYNGEEDVILDDLRPNQMKFQELLRVFDRYPFRVRVLGGSREFVAKRIFVTTTKPPSLFYENRTDEDIMQLIRRIEVVEHLK